MPGADEFIDLENNLSEVALALFEAGTVRRARCNGSSTSPSDAVDGCEAAGILLVDDGEVTTAAASSPLVVAVDQMQIDANEGPCLDAATRGSTFYADDLIDDARWPTFGPLAVDAGIRSVLAYSLSAEPAERAQPLLPAPGGVRRHRPRPGPAVRHARPPRPRLRRGTSLRRAADRKPHRGAPHP